MITHDKHQGNIHGTLDMIQSMILNMILDINEIRNMIQWRNLSVFIHHDFSYGSFEYEVLDHNCSRRQSLFRSLFRLLHKIKLDGYKIISRVATNAFKVKSVMTVLTETLAGDLLIKTLR